MHYRQQDALGRVLLTFGGGFAFWTLLLPALNHVFWRGWLTITLALIGVLMVVGGIVLRRKAKTDHRRNHADEVF